MAQAEVKPTPGSPLTVVMGASHNPDATCRTHSGEKPGGPVAPADDHARRHFASAIGGAGKRHSTGPK
jgi:hypothetical protein